MPVRVSNWIRVATLAIALIYAGIACKVSYDFIIDASRRAIKSPSYLMVPLLWPQLVIPIGFALLFLQLSVEIARAVRDVRTPARIEKAEEVQGA
jgi:TRAP-type C4-dicarboxylate transport system permease small subunit